MTSSANFPSSRWRELYRAALFETDTRKLPSRIEEAERELIRRGRQLFPMSVNQRDEAEAIDDALYALRALRNCLKLKTRNAEVAKAA